MRPETKIDALVFCLAVACGVSGYFTRAQLDTRFEALTGEYEGIESGPIQGVLFEILEDQRKEDERLESQLEREKAQEELEKLAEKEPVKKESVKKAPSEKTEDGNVSETKPKEEKVTAEGLMKKADKYLESGMKNAARQYLQRIIDDFSDSPLAEEARRKLEEIEE